VPQSSFVNNKQP